MKILLDANISWKLVDTLKQIFGECTHVDLIDIEAPSEDKDIWRYALKNNYTIITTDIDSLDLSECEVFPPKIVILDTKNNSSKSLAELLIKAKKRIEDFQEERLWTLQITKKEK